MKHTPDPALDLLLEREIPVPVGLVWKAWTDPETLKKWFTPKPWLTTECEIELFPGGKFRTVMEGPEGERFDGTSCILEAIENKRLVWCSALTAGFRPVIEPAGFTFTAIISMEPIPGGSKYSALVIHGDVEAKSQHEEMGFYSGWGTALDQLVELMS